jgi:hypothetical protein
MLFGLGGLLVLIGTIWLVITAIQTGETTGDKVIWALINFLCQPIGGIIFFIVKKQGMIPLILVIIGMIISGAGYATSGGEMLRIAP